MIATVTVLLAPVAPTRLMPLYCAELAIEVIVSLSAVISAFSFVASASGFWPWTTFSWICFSRPEICSAAVRATPTIAEAEVSESPSFL